MPVTSRLLTLTFGISGFLGALIVATWIDQSAPRDQSDEINAVIIAA